jgi:hypothetical protein
MSKHTPGPWAYALEYGPNITEPPRITTVAHCANYVIGLPSDYPGGNYRDGDPSGDEEADARLIAAAPDLLEALRGAVLLFACHAKDCTTMNWLDRAEAALTKAGGELFNVLVTGRQPEARN